MASKPTTIFRAQREAGNFFMAHKHGMNNEKLSWKAKGLLYYFMSLPDDWEINMVDLINRSTDGEKAVRSGLKELEAEGYFINERVYDPDTNKILYWLKRVREKPDACFVQVGNGQVQNLQVGNGDTTKNDKNTKNKKNTKNDDTPPPPKGEPVIPLPDILDFPEFHTTWAEWTQYRKEKRNALKPTTIKKQYNFMAKQPHNAVAIMETSMLNGWTGLFNLKDNKPSRNGRRAEPTGKDAIAEYLREYGND